MTKEQLNQLIAIRDNAPEGATHIENHIEYKRIIYLKRKLNKNTHKHSYYWFANDMNENNWYEHSNITGLVHSLDDIGTIIEQAERIEELEQESYRLNQALLSKKAHVSLMYHICCKLIENEEIFGSDWDYIGNNEYENVQNLLAIRDLEQQAKALEDYAKDLTNSMEAMFLLSNANQLLKKAEQLKQGVIK